MISLHLRRICVRHLHGYNSNLWQPFLSLVSFFWKVSKKFFSSVIRKWNESFLCHCLHSIFRTGGKITLLTESTLSIKYFYTLQNRHTDISALWKERVSWSTLCFSIQAKDEKTIEKKSTFLRTNFFASFIYANWVGLVGKVRRRRKKKEGFKKWNRLWWKMSFASKETISTLQMFFNFASCVNDLAESHFCWYYTLATLRKLRCNMKITIKIFRPCTYCTDESKIFFCVDMTAKMSACHSRISLSLLNLFQVSKDGKRISFFAAHKNPTTFQSKKIIFFLKWVDMARWKRQKKLWQDTIFYQDLKHFLPYKIRNWNWQKNVLLSAFFSTNHNEIGYIFFLRKVTTIPFFFHHTSFSTNTEKQ